MTAEKIIPYVVSADVNLLMQMWSKETGYTVPSPSFFSLLADERKGLLEEIFNTRIDVVSEDELRTGINQLTLQSRYPLLSLDRIYLDSSNPNLAGYVDMTRAVDEDLQDLLEETLYQRQGYAPIETQLAALASEKPEPVTIIDDVLFSGGSFVRLAEKLVMVNRPVQQATFGIGISDGLKRVREIGVEVTCVREYDEVIDEVCERDFLACVPLSGRTLISRGGEYWGAPYFHPFGNPEKWASIPAVHVEVFSEFCLAQSIRLWREIEMLSGTSISTDMVPRRIMNLKPNNSIVVALQEYCSSN